MTDQVDVRVEHEPTTILVLVPKIEVSKVKGKVCLRITKYDPEAKEEFVNLIHSGACNCAWSDK